MKRRLTFIFVGSAILAVVLALFCNWYFPDVVPLASTEPVPTSWRLDAAFAVSTVRWTATFVAAASAIALMFMNITRGPTRLEGR
ncbi:hypothetical protein [Bradyrhizobium embrapense]|uniref:hypothetical protein n=1 Tax=Bradyrhizobium embrapense TaxID=630921 RepID=UPI00067DE7BE|nr:hypothetical protein [Bradyrhizobium embrapense]